VGVRAKVLIKLPCGSNPDCWMTSELLSPGLCGIESDSGSKRQQCGHRQLIRPRAIRRLGGASCGLNHSGYAADFGPHPECLRPGGSMLGGSGVIAAEVEEIIDLIVG
jgi:hypothetical protein